MTSLRILAAALALPLGCAWGAPSSVSVSDGRYVMGTVLEITLVGPDEARARAALEELFALATRLDALLSVYDEASELSRLNAAAGTGPRPVDPELARVLALSQDYSRLTRGAFDVTVGPLVDLWTDAARAGVPPSHAELARARTRVGSALIQVRQDGTVALAKPDVVVNLGGVAKGYAIDRMLSVLGQHGIRNALLSFGQSSTWALGSPADGDHWRLLARGAGDDFLGVLELSNQALSVSESLGQFVEIGGRQYGHVLDPRTGQPLTTRRQAYVIAGEAALAEALSKALLILDPSAGIALIESLPNCEALLVAPTGPLARTSGFPQLD